MNREVNLTKRVRLPGSGLRYCPVVIAANGRIKPDVVLVGGAEERHPEGAYYLEWRDGAKRIRISVGKVAADALGRKLRKEAELKAVANGVTVLSDAEENGRRSLSAAVTDYLDEIRITKKPKTHSAYRVALDYFTDSCHKLHLDEINRSDMLRYSAYLRDELEQSPRSVANKFENVLSFLKWAGIRNLVHKNDWPRYTEEEPEIYEPADLRKLFAACDDQERLWYEFFLMTGEREQEVMHTFWSDLDMAAGVVRVSHKPDYHWTPKAYKEREIPIPAKLVKRLTAWKKKRNKDCPLLFPTTGCHPKLDFLDCLKAVARRAKLNPDDCWLHKFRATFATRCLQSGIDLRTVQAWLGHSDLASTMRYLKPARIDGMRRKVDAVFA